MISKLLKSALLAKKQYVIRQYIKCCRDVEVRPISGSYLSGRLTWQPGLLCSFSAQSVMQAFIVYESRHLDVMTSKKDNSHKSALISIVLCEGHAK